MILDQLRKNTVVINPVVLFCGIIGIFTLGTHRIITVAIFTAAILGYIISNLKPQLELDRMIVAMSLLLCFPASKYFTIIRDFKTQNSILMGFLLLSPIWTYNMSSNNSTENYSLANEVVKELSLAINKNAGNGRTLFAGFTLHELNGGHVAPLAHWTKKPLIASSYQHDKWNYTDVIPEYYRKRKEQGVLEYLNLMNVSSVVAHDSF